MTIDELAVKLGLEPTGKRRIRAACPLHPTDGQKLTAFSEFGAIVIECKKGCPDHLIAAKLDLDLNDLFDDDDEDFFTDPRDKTPGELLHAGRARGPSQSDVPAGSLLQAAPPSELPDWGHERTNAFDIKPAAEWTAASSARPVPRHLFGDFWLEGELSILFGDTGKGKSALAVQIAECIANGVGIAPFEAGLPAGEKIIYMDFELSDKMFESRYSRDAAYPGGPVTDLYPFSRNFLRAQIGFHLEVPTWCDTWGEYLTESFDELFKTTGARLLIVDNIAALASSNIDRPGGTGNALRAMKVLRRFQHTYGLSILVLAHTPKRRYSRGISVDDLQGSKNLANFADNIFAIGDSCLGPDIRYLKHIKPRNTRLIYDSSNVITYRIEKESNFLSFDFLGFSHEREHLENITLQNDLNRRVMIRKVQELSATGMTQRDIAAHLGLAVTTVNRYLKRS